MRMTIKYANPLGEFDEKFGQRYWGKSHDSDMDISFNLMHPINFEDGDEIEFEEKTIKEKGPNSKNPGQEYLFLKKVKRSGESPRAETHSEVKPDSKFLKDTSDLPFRVWQALLPYLDQQGLIKSPDYSKSINSFVASQTNLLLGMIDSIRAHGTLGEESGYEKAKAQAAKIKGEITEEDLSEIFPDD